jgi:hypothetical protein
MSWSVLGTFLATSQDGLRRVNGHNVQGCEKRVQIRFNNDDVSPEAAANESAITNSVLNRRAPDAAIHRCLNNIESALRVEFGAINNSG